jgi:seryl-tRNA synthetase
VLDLKWLRAHPDAVRRGLRRKGEDEGALDRLLDADAGWRRLLQEVEALRAPRNAASEEVGRRKARREDASALLEELRGVSDRLDAAGDDLAAAEASVRELLLRIPNLPDDDVPDGPDESANVEVARWGEPVLSAAGASPLLPRPHWDLGTSLGLLDFERGGKVSGARFAFYRGAGARLVRALAAFMLDLHCEEHGYTEVWSPLLVKGASMLGTGQLPKFSEDAFSVEGRDLWLIPTAEVPLTNLHRDEVLDDSDLPVRMVGFSSCFRSEAGAAGRDTRGLIRQHQFEKVELVWLVRPEESDQALPQLIDHAAEVLRRLGLPYRLIQMCTGDLGFAAARKYDLEVWMPSYGRYVEISSCSNFRDFQARRASIRFRRGSDGRGLDFVHTLNGSGVAIGRTVAALLENCQQPDGSVLLPEPLAPYMRGQRLLAAPGGGG